MATYPFVRSAVDLGRTPGPRLGMAWHHAEGGGTVGYLSRANPNGVSVHFVVEYTGRVVQMLALDHLHTSIRVTAVRTSDDPPYDWNGTPVTYGATAAGDVLGGWWKNPNNASIGVEVEGFARDGPNPAQTVAIEKLWLDMAGRYPGIRSLGHRDFADYKACPGKRFPWDRVGGHGKVAEQDEPMKPFPVADDPKIAAIKTGAQLYNLDLAPAIKVQNAPGAQSPYGYRTGGIDYRLVEVPTGGVPHLWLVRKSDCVLSEVSQPLPPEPVPAEYPVTVGGKPAGKVTLP